MKPKTLGKITPLVLTKELHDELPRLVTGQGGYQGTFRRIHDSITIVDGKPVARLTPKDLESLREWAQRSDEGSWQDWARRALAANA
jgi:hypothetical protein